MKPSRPTAGIFVDVQNIYYTCRDHFHRPFDYRKFYAAIASECEIKFAFAYAIQSQNDGQHKFQRALSSNGYKVKTKPFIQRNDGSAKGDWDVGITIDIMDTAEQLDRVYLLSGDGDFAHLMVRLKDFQATQSHVVSVEALTARALIDSCHVYTPIDASMLIS